MRCGRVSHRLLGLSSACLFKRVMSVLFQHSGIDAF